MMTKGLSCVSACGLAALFLAACSGSDDPAESEETGGDTGAGAAPAAAAPGYSGTAGATVSPLGPTGAVPGTGGIPGVGALPGVTGGTAGNLPSTSGGVGGSGATAGTVSGGTGGATTPSGGTSGSGGASGSGGTTETPGEPAGDYAVADGGFVSVCGMTGYSWLAAGPEAAGVNGTASSILPEDFSTVTAGSALCATGVVSGQEDYGGYAMIGVNIGQEAGEDTPNANIQVTGDGLNVNVANNGTSDLRVQIQDDLGGDDENHRWCANLEDGANFIPWSSFNTQCWDDKGNFYANEPINAVLILVPGSDSDDTAFDFCLNSFAPNSPECTGATPGGTGGAGGTGGTGTEVTGGTTGDGGTGGSTGGETGEETGGEGGSGATESGGTGGDGETGGGAGTTPAEDLGGYHIHGDWAGFAFTFATEATIEPDAETGFQDMLDQDGPYCASGTVPATEEYTAIAAVGFNTNQPKVEDAPVGTIASQSTGLLVNISNPGNSSSLRVQIEDGTDPEDPDADQHRWCINISDFDTDLVIPWESFNLTCWDPDDDTEADGTAFDPSTPIAKVIVYYPDEGPEGADATFDFCVNDIGPADVTTRGEGELVPSCGNTVSWTTTSLSGTSSALTSDGSYGIQANGWDDGGGGISISALGSCGFNVDQTNCNKTSETDGPCSFPSVYRGVRWGGDNSARSGGFPAQVSSIGSIPTCLGWSGGSGDGYNVSFDVWFSSNSSATQPDKYLMLWFRTPQNWQPAGDFPEANGVMIGSMVWSRWYGPNTDGQNVVTYQAPSERAEGQAYSFNLKDFIDDAVEQGHISASDYLISVMGGIEIWEGGNGASIDGFSVEVQ